MYVQLNASAQSKHNLFFGEHGVSRVKEKVRAKRKTKNRWINSVNRIDTGNRKHIRYSLRVANEWIDCFVSIEKTVSWIRGRNGTEDSIIGDPSKNNVRSIKIDASATIEIWLFWFLWPLDRSAFDARVAFHLHICDGMTRDELINWCSKQRSSGETHIYDRLTLLKLKEFNGCMININLLLTTVLVHFARSLHMWTVAGAGYLRAISQVCTKRCKNDSIYQMINLYSVNGLRAVVSRCWCVYLFATSTDFNRLQRRTALHFTALTSAPQLTFAFGYKVITLTSIYSHNRDAGCNHAPIAHGTQWVNGKRIKIGHWICAAINLRKRHVQIEFAFCIFGAFVSTPSAWSALGRSVIVCATRLFCSCISNCGCGAPSNSKHTKQ